MRNAVRFAFIWLLLFMIITLSWVGAEYIFEEAVHDSRVDGAVAGLLAYYMARTMIGSKDDA